MSTELLACEVGLWLVFFILLLLAVRTVMKAFCPNRAVFRSGNDVKRKRREEEESSEEMMKPEKAHVIVNGQRYVRLYLHYYLGNKYSDK